MRQARRVGRVVRADSASTSRHHHEARVEVVFLSGDAPAGGTLCGRDPGDMTDQETTNRGVDDLGEP
jgi:hypothetical protein